MHPLRCSEFAAALGFAQKDNYILQRIFHVIDVNGDGQLNFAEFAVGLSHLCSRAPEQDRYAPAIRTCAFSRQRVPRAGVGQPTWQTDAPQTGEQLRCQAPGRGVRVPEGGRDGSARCSSRPVVHVQSTASACAPQRQALDLFFALPAATADAPSCVPNSCVPNYLLNVATQFVLLLQHV